MKRTIAIIFSLFGLSFLITGCSTTAPKLEPTIVYNTKIKPVPIPAYLLENCPIPLPPNRENYVKLTPEEKEEVLANYTIELHKNITKCNNTVDAVRDWNVKQLKAFTDQDKK